MYCRCSETLVRNGQEAAAQVCIVLYDAALVSDTHQSFGPVLWYGSAVPGSALAPNASVSVKVPSGVRLVDSLAVPMPAEPTHAVTGPYTTRQLPWVLFCQARSVARVADGDDAVTVISWDALPSATGIVKSGAVAVLGAVVVGAVVFGGAVVLGALVFGAVVLAGAVVRGTGAGVGAAGGAAGWSGPAGAAGAAGEGGVMGSVMAEAADVVRAAARGFPVVPPAGPPAVPAAGGVIPVAEASPVDVSCADGTRTAVLAAVGARDATVLVGRVAVLAAVLDAAAVAAVGAAPSGSAMTTATAAATPSTATTTVPAMRPALPLTVTTLPTPPGAVTIPALPRGARQPAPGGLARRLVA